jgi:hypothetical protein
MHITPRNGAAGRALPCDSEAVGGALTRASFQERARKRSVAARCQQPTPSRKQIVTIETFDFTNRPDTPIVVLETGPRPEFFKPRQEDFAMLRIGDRFPDREMEKLADSLRFGE